MINDGYKPKYSIIIPLFHYRIIPFFNHQVV